MVGNETAFAASRTGEAAKEGPEMFGMALRLFTIGMVVLTVGACSDSSSGEGGEGGDAGLAGDVLVGDVPNFGGDGNIFGNKDGEGTTDGVSEEDVGEEPDLVEDVTPEPDVTTEPDVVEDVTPEPDVVEDVTTEPDVVEDVTTEPDLTTEPDVEVEPDVVEEPNYGEPIAVSSISPYESGWLHALAVDDIGRVTVLWSGHDPTDGQEKLLLSRSNPEVSGFQSAFEVKALVGGAASGADEGDVAVDEEEHLLVWREQPTNQPGGIYFRRCQIPDLDGEDVVVYEGSPGESLYRPYFVRKSLTTICVFWQQNKDIFFSCSIDAGGVFTVPTQVDPPGMTSTQSSALFDINGRLVVVYQGKEPGDPEYRIYMQTSEDDGQTFTDPVQLSGPSLGTDKHVDPSLALGPSWIYAGWHESAFGGLDAIGWFARSGDGESWEVPTNLPTIGESVIVRSGKAEAVYATGKIPIINVLLPTAAFSISEDGGGTWSDAVELELPENTFIIDHDIVANRKKGLLHAVWWEFHAPDGQFSLDITERDLWVATIDL